MYTISTYDLFKIYNYASAKQHYESITPIRGSTIRPIGKRNKKHMQIVENRDPTHGHYYAARLYNTECVRYYENGKIQVQCEGWVSQSTAKFIDAVSPFVASIGNNLLWVHNNAMNVTRDGLWFERSAADGVGGWQCLNPPNYYINTLNKETTKRIRNLPALKATQQYLKHMKALGVYEGVRGISAWERQQKTDTLFNQILRHPDTEPDLETLAELGDVAGGPFNWEWVYRRADEVGITTNDKLYDKTYITERVNRKGVLTE
jgi:hypothetical protein